MLIPLVLTPEQEALRQTVRRLCDREKSEREVTARTADPRRYDHRVWADLAAVGVPSLGVPEHLGGVGGDARDWFLVFRELGRTLLPSPTFGTVALAGSVLACAGNVSGEGLLQRVAAGEITAALALCEEDGDYGLAGIRMPTRETSRGYELHGTKRFVMDGASADVLLVVARHGTGELGVFSVDSQDSTVQRSVLETLDLTRPQADITFRGSPAQLVSVEVDCQQLLEQALTRATLALVAEQVGGAEHVLEAAIAYAGERVQFGRPIGAFQAVKHKLADMAFDVERMLAAGWHAALELADGEPGARRAVSLAKAFCSEAYFRTCAEGIQIHGGIGFTWEHEAHLYYRRAKSSELVLGGPRQHREAVLASLLEAR